jgi:hypothetical protein
VVVTPNAAGVAHVQISSTITVVSGPTGPCGIRCGK